MSGWGIGPWGIGPWGGLSSSSISISGAFAVSTNTVRVTLSNTPQEIDATTPGDVLNPATWVVTRLDTGQVFTILQVRAASAPYVWDIDVLEPFGSYPIVHRVASTVLLASFGVVISAPTSADFVGVAAAAVSVQSARRVYNPIDIANPPAPVGIESLGGTLIINADSDYRNEAGAPLLRKLITRRLVTAPGEFFHLPGYGVGISGKEPLRGGDVARLEKQIQQQVLAEPDVESCQAKVSLSRKGVLTIQIKVVQRKTGEAVEIGLKVTPPGGVQL